MAALNRLRSRCAFVAITLTTVVVSGLGCEGGDSPSNNMVDDLSNIDDPGYPPPGISLPWDEVQTAVAITTTLVLTATPPKDQSLSNFIYQHFELSQLQAGMDTAASFQVSPEGDASRASILVALQENAHYRMVVAGAPLVERAADFLTYSCPVLSSISASRSWVTVGTSEEIVVQDGVGPLLLLDGEVAETTLSLSTTPLRGFALGIKNPKPYSKLELRIPLTYLPPSGVRFGDCPQAFPHAITSEHFVVTLDLGSEVGPTDKIRKSVSTLSF